MTGEATAPEPRPAPDALPQSAPCHDLVVVRVRLPAHLRTLVQLEQEAERGTGHGSGHGNGSEVRIQLDSPRTQSSLLDALETRYPVLLGTIRDPRTRVRRPFIRFFACEEDLSHEPPDRELPEPVLAGAEPFVILGAMAGG